jgi:hypothetical protein
MHLVSQDTQSDTQEPLKQSVLDQLTQERNQKHINIAQAIKEKEEQAQAKYAQILESYQQAWIDEHCNNNVNLIAQDTQKQQLLTFTATRHGQTLNIQGDTNPEGNFLSPKAENNQILQSLSFIMKESKNQNDINFGLFRCTQSQPSTIDVVQNSMKLYWNYFCGWSEWMRYKTKTSEIIHQCITCTKIEAELQKSFAEHTANSEEI